MPEMIARSLSSSTPAVCASATTRCSSSAVTTFLFSRLRPSSRKISALVRSSSQTNGAVTFDSQMHRPRHDRRDRLGRAQRELLGHQLADDQRAEGGDDDDEAEADASARFPASSPSKREPLADRPAEARARIGAGENADQRDPDLHRRQEAARVGGERRARICAPPLPDLAIAFSRASRDETIASSLIANTPLSAISARIRTMSNQGMGAKGPLMIEAFHAANVRAAAARRACRIDRSMRNYRRRPPFPTAIPIKIRRYLNASFPHSDRDRPVGRACRHHRLHHRSLHRPPDHLARPRSAPASALLGGYLAGDVVGGRSDRTAKIIGAGVGALAGGAVGAYMDRQEAELRRQTAGTGVDVIRSGDDLILRMPSGDHLPGRQLRPSSRSSSRPSTRSRRRSAATTRPMSTSSATPIRPAATPITRRCRSIARQSVANYLASRGVGSARIGDARLWRKRADRVERHREGRAQNRRVEIKVVPVDPAAQGY